MRAILLPLLLLLVRDGSASCGVERPNILFILIDDAGYNDLCFKPFAYQHRGVKTPNLKHLAKNGIRMSNYYAQTSCTPSRCSLMTGRYDTHVGCQANIQPHDAHTVPLSETFLSQNLQDVGYETGIFGKWHLGHSTPAALPHSRGFEFQYGPYLGSTKDHLLHTRRGEFGPSGFDWHNNGTIDFSAAGTYAPTLITNMVVKKIKERKNVKQRERRPFFYYVSYLTPHGPLQCPEKWLKRHEDKKVAVLACVDFYIGKILKALRNTEDYDNTLVVFSSDNGATKGSGDSNLPFRGFKKSLWDGALRVPALVFHPSFPPSLRGTIRTGLYHVTDWLPTLVNLAGGNTARNKPIDGFDIWDSLTSGVASPRTEILHGIMPGCKGPKADPRTAYRWGHMKLLIDCFIPETSEITGRLWLYNITADPSETTNLAFVNADIIQTMFEKLKHQTESFVPVAECPGCPMGQPIGEPPRWEPWLDV
eukprot:TRINITY_DN103783_c0_g1_i1.p1 TRINITY_DN103783_c0_g1~~TRINITY_DN103783_c0_g1_i1.p1  ORF type:complete len:478 (-),score=36.14 TRINITY_DN103783_c0_g1_i1:197-1630(-)